VRVSVVIVVVVVAVEVVTALVLQGDNGNLEEQNDSACGYRDKESNDT
jgi:hypothetical protein